MRSTFSFAKISLKGCDFMGRPIGKANRPNKKWTKEEKLNVVKRYLNDGVGFKTIAKEFETGHSTIRRWVHEYLDQGIAAFDNSKKTGNHFAALHTSKSLTEEERLKLIIAKQEIEIERLKKGYIVKGVGVNKEFVTLKDVNTR